MTNTVTGIVTAITELRRSHELAALLELAVIPRNTYYYHCRKAQSKDKYKLEKSEITAIYKENQGRCGDRRILMELRNRGYGLNHKPVQKLMKDLGLKCMIIMKKYRSYRGEVGKTAPNLLNRDFYAENRTKYEQLTLPKFLCFAGNCICFRFWICIIDKLSAMQSVNGQILNRLQRCWIKHLRSILTFVWFIKIRTAVSKRSLLI